MQVMTYELFIALVKSYFFTYGLQVTIYCTSYELIFRHEL